jgi:hypothetical protein
MSMPRIGKCVNAVSKQNDFCLQQNDKKKGKKANELFSRLYVEAFPSEAKTKKGYKIDQFN